jgi:hypothetical protein
MKYWYLIQNTWLKVQLLEVSMEYLIKHLHKSEYGGITFLNFQLQSDRWEYCNGIFLESDIHDTGDGCKGLYEDSDNDKRLLEGKTL